MCILSLEKQIIGMWSVSHCHYQIKKLQLGKVGVEESRMTFEVNQSQGYQYELKFMIHV